jgi:hypothetical protein
LPDLKGKTLFCWCKPDACHGDVLAELADVQDSAGSPDAHARQDAGTAAGRDD